MEENQFIDYYNQELQYYKEYNQEYEYDDYSIGESIEYTIAE
jgi:hypothetical protein